MIELFSGIAGLVFSNGLESFRASKEFDNARQMIREFAKREAHYNAELLQLASNLPKDDSQQGKQTQCKLTCLVKDEVFQRLQLVPLPLALVFNSKLDDQWWGETFNALGTKNKKHQRQARDLCTEASLIERAYHWSSINKAFAEVGTLRGDRKYSVLLFKAVELSVGRAS